MRNLESFSDETWDRFFEFLADGLEETPIEEVRQELKDAGIDVKPVQERVWRMIEERRNKR